MNNRAPHKKTKLKGFTLIEIMIAVAIIGIISAIALPSYNNYVIKAKLQEAMYYLERAKLAVNIYHQDGGDLSNLVNNPASYSALGLKKTINSKYINEYWIKPWSGNDISIWVITKSGTIDLPASLKGKWPFYFVGNKVNKEIKWQCKSDYDNGSLTKYAPAKCR